MYIELGYPVLNWMYIELGYPVLNIYFIFLGQKQKFMSVKEIEAF
jgi:hypothetical protein